MHKFFSYGMALIEHVCGLTIELVEQLTSIWFRNKLPQSQVLQWYGKKDLNIHVYNISDSVFHIQKISLSKMSWKTKTMLVTKDKSTISDLYSTKKLNKKLKQTKKYKCFQ